MLFKDKSVEVFKPIESEVRPNLVANHSAPPTRAGVQKPDGIGRVRHAMQPSVRNQRRLSFAPVRGLTDFSHFAPPTAEQRRKARNKRKAARRGC